MVNRLASENWPVLRGSEWEKAYYRVLKWHKIGAGKVPITLAFFSLAVASENFLSPHGSWA